MGTAVKNRTLGNTLTNSDNLLKLKVNFDKLKGQMTPQVMFDVWFKFSMMRDLARNIFHGSVCCDILENT